MNTALNGQHRTRRMKRKKTGTIMQLGQAQQERALAHINAKLRRCPSCGSAGFGIDVTVYEAREFQGGGLAIGAGNMLPLIAATCNSCGMVVTFNAVVLGLLNQDGTLKA
jgi:hypothetical protein